jgi:hypothetical protein
MKTEQLLLLCALFLFQPIGQAIADIAPNPLSGGKSLAPRDAEIEDVRMFEEDVQVRIFKDSIETIADFYMINDGETVTMEVGFPYAYQNDFIEFRAFVDDIEVDVREDKVEKTIRGKHIVTRWKLWTMTFYEGKTCNIRVEYTTQGFGYSDFRIESGKYLKLPAELLEEMEHFTRCEHVEYYLATGSRWKGKLDKCKIVFRLEDYPVDRIEQTVPKTGKRTDYGMIWEYADFEPTGIVYFVYYPNMPSKEIAPYLYNIVKQYPDNPDIADNIGHRIYKYIGGKALQDKIYRESIERWDGSVPNLIKRGSDGRCMYDHENDNHFYSIYRMAHILLKQYQRNGQHEEAMEIAPILAKLSGAIIDAFDSCDTIGKSAKSMLDRARTDHAISWSIINDK